MHTAIHVLAGYAGGKTLSEEWDDNTYTYLFLTATIVPDLDFFLNWFGMSTYLKYHRGVTNSIFTFPLLALLTAFGFWYIYQHKSFLKFLIASLAAMALHVFMDLLNSFGVPLLFPFSWQQRFHLDWVWIIDPYMTLILLIPIVARLLTGTWKQAVLRGTLITFFCYTVFCGANRYMAKQTILENLDSLEHLETQNNEIENHTGIHRITGNIRIENIKKIGVLPQPLLPTRWTGIVEHEHGTTQLFVNSLNGNRYAEDVSFIFPSSMRTDLKEAAKTDYDALVFWHFARFPVPITETEHGRIYADLQFNIRPTPHDVLGSLWESNYDPALPERSTPFSVHYTPATQNKPPDITWRKMD